MRNNLYKIYLLYICLFFPVFAFSQILNLNPQKHITQYKIKIRTVENGLPSNAITSIIQAADGYIWISTFNGISRFDGKKFTNFDITNTNELESNIIQTATLNIDSVLWFGSLKGITGYKNGIFFRPEQLNLLKNSIIEVLYSDSEGNLWIGTNSEGLYKFNGKKLEKITELEKYTKGIISAISGNNNKIFVGTEKGELFAIEQNKVIPYKFDTECNGINSIRESKIEDLFWISTGTGLYTLQNNILSKYKKFNELKVTQIIEAPEQAFVLTEHGLYKLNRATLESELLNETNGLSNNILIDGLIDKEGNLWIGTYRKGLLQISDGDFWCYSETEGLKSNLITGITQMHDGGIILGDENGTLYRLADNTITVFNVKITLPESRLKQLFTDSDNNLWISTYGGLIKSTGKQSIIFNKKSGFADDLIRLVFEDSKKNIYVGTRSTGVHLLKRDGTFNTIDVNNGLTSNYIMSFAEDKNGNLVVGTKNGINIIANFKVIKTYSTNNGFPTNFSFNTYIDKNNVYWVGTNDGLMRIENDKVFLFNVKNGLKDNSIYDIFEDEANNLWLPGTTGISVISLNDLNNFAAGKIQNYKVVFFNETDGMKKSEGIGATKSIKSADGSLYFLTTGGVASINPSELKTNTIYPRVIIENIRIGDTIYNRQNSITLSGKTGKFEIDFTALHYSSGENIQLKYKLEPYETEWQDASLLRRATYTNINPGTYYFRVIACNKSGIWNMEGDRIEIIILPKWHQAWWFRIAVFLFAVLLIYLIYKIRIYQIERQKRELEYIVKERTALVIQQKEELSVQAENLREANEEILIKSEELAEQNTKLELAYNNVNNLNEIGRKITSRLDISTIIKTVYENVNKLMDATVFAIGLYNKQFNRLDFTGTIEKGEELPFHYDFIDEKCFSSICFNTKRILVISDLHNEYQNYFPELMLPKAGEIPESLIYLPLMFQDNIVGVLTVQSFSKNSYTNYHVNILQNIALFTVIALNNADAFFKIELQNQQITGSIKYAQTIQQSILLSSKDLSESFDNFIIYKPKDIVSGDFYWHGSVFNDEFDIQYNFIAVFDCTGHGVPGAFMSLIGHRLLSEVVNEKHIYDPAVIFDKMDIGLKTALKHSEKENQDGMDACLVRLKKMSDGKTEIVFCGAKRPLIYYKQNTTEVLVKKANRRSIGFSECSGKQVCFANEIIELETNDVLYLTTDGYIDQNNKERRRFGSQKFLSLLNNIVQKDFIAQKEILENELYAYMQDEIQRDDITVVGIRI